MSEILWEDIMMIEKLLNIINENSVNNEIRISTFYCTKFKLYFF